MQIEDNGERAPVQYFDGTEGMDWDELNDLFVRAPLGERPAQKFRKACQYSPVVVQVRWNKKLIGFGRALTDFMGYAAIYDVVVEPKFQGRGIGREIMQRILKRVEMCGYITLFVAPGKEGFYEKLGFKKMKSAMLLCRNEEAARKRGHI